MEKQLTWHDAIYNRTSRRTYTGESLEPRSNTRSKSDHFQYYEVGLHFRLLEDLSPFFTKFKTSYSMFKNVQSVIALVGNPHKMENLDAQWILRGINA